MTRIRRWGWARKAPAGAGALSGHLRPLIDDPVLWTMSPALNGAAMGIVWVMTTKPGWAGSIGTVAAGAAVGALVGYIGVRRRRGRGAATRPGAAGD